jgi:hypothetical protein
MTQAKSPTLPVHHPVRTIFAALFGAIALSLVIATVLIVWLNRTLTDTPTYVQTVAPLVSQPAIQTFVVEKATDQIMKAAPTAELAQRLLPAADIAGKTEDQVRTLVRPALEAELKKTVASAQFAQLWKDTNESAHTQLKKQIESGSGELTLDLSPVVNGAIAQLKATEFGDLADKIEVPQEATKLNLKGGSLDQAHRDYVWLQQTTVALVIITLVSIGLSVWLSVHHQKTLRRILVISAVLTLGLAAIIQAPALVQVDTKDPVMRDAVVALAGVLFHNLQIMSLVIGGVCLVMALLSKIAETALPKRA